MSSTAPVLDVEKHVYTLNGKPLVSVSKVIDAVMRKSFDGVDPEILRNAAERGTRVEQYATTLFMFGFVEIPLGERTDVVERFELVYKWWERHKPTLISAQKQVWDSEVAGTLDYVLDIDGVRWLVDLKNTASFEPSWSLQIGAYLHLSGHAGPGAVLHINPKYTKGYMWRTYDHSTCVRQWLAAFDWYRTLQELQK